MKQAKGAQTRRILSVPKAEIDRRELKKKRRRVGAATLAVLLTATALFYIKAANGGMALPAQVTKDLDTFFNGGDAGGFLTKGWAYRGDQEFVIYVVNRDKFMKEYAALPRFPQHAVGFAMAADTFLSAAHTEPKVFIFKDGPQELFRLDYDKLVADIEDAKHR
jgi:hypothetical protein